MKIALTGGTGFVGGYLASQLRGSGHNVVLLSRNRADDPEAMRWSMDSAPRPDSLRGFDLLIHCAWDLSATDDRNVAGSQRLFNAARTAGIPHIIFVSSLSAFEGCRSHYGQTKLAAEKLGAAAGVRSVRLGFVWDGSDRGLSGGLRKLARLPLIPLPDFGQQRLFALHAGDLGAALLGAAQLPGADPISVAHPQPVTLREMVRSFASEQGRRAIFLPVPWWLLWFPLRSAEASGARLRFRSDSLVSLMNQNPAPDFRALARTGTQLRPFSANGGD